MVCPQDTEGLEWIETLPKPWTLSQKEITKILPGFHKRFPDFQKRLKAFSLWQLGKPYEAFKLGEEIEPDSDPIIRLDVSDCTVHVLTSLAFSQSTSWDEAKKKMIRIHYKDQRPTFMSRWHFTTDRILLNPSTVNITEELISKDSLTFVQIILNRKENGEEFLDLNWEQKILIGFIPNEKINQKLLNSLPEICGLCFIKKSYFKMGIAVAHEGMLIDQKNLIHASSEYGKTVQIDFMDYYFREDGAVFDGILIYSFLPLEK